MKKCKDKRKYTLNLPKTDQDLPEPKGTGGTGPSLKRNSSTHLVKNECLELKFLKS